MNISEAAELLAIAVAVMPNLQEKELRPTAAAWAAIMPDLDFLTAQDALIRILREKEYSVLPLPAELLRVAREVKPRAGDPPMAIEAWHEVRMNADIYKAPKWSHPLIAEAVKVIGYRNICCGEFDLGSRFIKTYEDLLNRRRIDEENKVVISITDGRKIKFLGGQ